MLLQLPLLALAFTQVQALKSTFIPLGLKPPTVNNLNGESFQQDALATFNNFQYSAFYAASSPNDNVNTSRHVSVGRRFLPSGKWEILTLTDYNQTLDDGHDVISIGICPGDGTLHLGFDQHNNNLNYRRSKTGVAGKNVTWDASIFGGVVNALPGLESVNPNPFFTNVTYPRFLTLPSKEMLMEFRVGRSGLGDDWLYSYSSKTGNFSLVGKYLLGVNNNAYINGLDVDNKGVLQATWTYRDFINDTGINVAVQAGPNGPENNHDMNYAFSPDFGKTWKNNWGQVIAQLNGSTANDAATNETFSGNPIQPNSPGIVMFGIPKFGGILNQESQTTDSLNRVHVLNRENTTTDGVERWYHYWRSTTIDWTRTALPESINDVLKPTVIGKRGKILPSNRDDSVYLLLPSNVVNSTALSLYKSTSGGHFRDWQEVWSAAEGCLSEPVFDRYRLKSDGVLSVLVTNGTQVGVLDITL